MKKIVFFTALLFSGVLSAHEQWLIPLSEMIKLSQQPVPEIFRQWGLFNSSIIFLAAIISLFWIFFKTPGFKVSSITTRVQWAAFTLRIFTGFMLIATSLGMLPKIGIPLFMQPTLFASDLIIPHRWLWLQYIELSLAIALLCGWYTRIVSGLFIFLFSFSYYLYGPPILQYAGFYIGIFVFLLREGGGSYALSKNYFLDNITYHKISIFILQILTGANFIYSGISVKLLQPNLDIYLLNQHKAFSFGMPYDYFSFVMCIVEIFMGIIILTGIRLDIIAFILISLFTFLSINLSETIFAHLFLYGILISFIFTKGISFSWPIRNAQSN